MSESTVPDEAWLPRPRGPRPWPDQLAPDGSEPEAAAVLRAAAGLTRTSLQAFAVRTGSLWVRDAYARRLTRGRLGFDAFAVALAASLRGDEESVAALDPPALDPSALDPSLALNFARTLAAQRGPGDLVADLLTVVATAEAAGMLTAAERDQLVAALLGAGRTAQAREVLDHTSPGSLTDLLLRADVANPWAAGSTGDVAAWLADVNGLFTAAGLEPVSLDPAASRTPFDSLRAGGTAVSDPGPVVTVLVTCFRPGPELLSAVGSLLLQTWTAWEAIVLDDASGPEYADVLDQVAALDPRIRVVRAERNEGTYARRNDGLALATGDLVTVHDSDDWAHPRRLELQARHLVEHPGLPANWSRSLRVTEDLRFVTSRSPTLQPTEASLMFRRREVTERVGCYDHVRAAADREYRQRVEAAFAVEIPVVGPEAPLQLLRFTSGSVSGSDTRSLWVHPSRIAYRGGFTRWHEQIRAHGVDPRLPRAGGRPFPAPAHLAVERATRVHDLDVLVVMDTRASAGPAGLVDTVAAELSALDGVRVGLVHVDSLVEDPSPGELADVLQDLVNAGRVTQVVLSGEEVVTRLVLVRNVSVLQGSTTDRLPVRAERVVLLEDRVSGRDRRGRTFALDDVRRIAAAQFGLEAEHRVADDERAVRAAYLP